MSSSQHVAGQVPDLKRRDVPASALVVSFLALAIASIVNLAWPEVLPDYFALVWVLALIPPFLLAYYRGWEGAALALAAGMILLIGVEVGGSLITNRVIRWWIVGGVIFMLIGVSLGAGAVAEKLHSHTSDALQMAFSDPLTGLPNRRILDAFLSKEFAAAQRGSALSVAVFDIDGFKSYNDTRGHSAGDDALRLVAGMLDKNTRAMNVSGRQGGDEFLALLPGEPLAGAYHFAERVRAAIADSAVARERSLTVSAGVAAYSPPMADPKELLEAADRSLYAAKRLGGNAVVASGELDDGAATSEMRVLHADGQVR